MSRRSSASDNGRERAYSLGSAEANRVVTRDMDILRQMAHTSTFATSIALKAGATEERRKEARKLVHDLDRHFPAAYDQKVERDKERIRALARGDTTKQSAIPAFNVLSDRELNNLREQYRLDNAEFAALQNDYSESYRVLLGKDNNNLLRFFKRLAADIDQHHLSEDQVLHLIQHLFKDGVLNIFYQAYERDGINAALRILAWDRVHIKSQKECRQDQLSFKFQFEDPQHEIEEYVELVCLAFPQYNMKQVYRKVIDDVLQQAPSHIVDAFLDQDLLNDDLDRLGVTIFSPLAILDHLVNLLNAERRPSRGKFRSFPPSNRSNTFQMRAPNA